MTPETNDAHSDARLHRSRQFRTALLLILVAIGIALSALSLAADFLGLDLTPGFGIVQMFQLLIGLTLLTLAAFLFAHGRRPSNAPRSLQADIGVRLAATGLVFSYVAGLSDLLGIGTHVTPAFERPYIGPLQLGGVLVGLGMIILGIILYATSRGTRDASALQFLLNESESSVP